MKINIIIFFALCVLLVLIAGCRGAKTVIKFTDNSTSVALNCYPTRAPFSNDPNFYCSLKIPSIALNAKIDNFFIFKSSDGYIGFIFKDKKRKRVLITSVSKTPYYIRHNTPGELIRSLYKPFELQRFSFDVLDHQIDLDNVECVQFHWSSGGVTYLGFNKFDDGLASLFKTGYYRESMDKSNSGRVFFKKWKKWRPRFLYDWPTIDRIETFDKPNE